MNQPKRVSFNNRAVRKPTNTVLTGRQTRWGNPFQTGAQYRRWLVDDAYDPTTLIGKIPESELPARRARILAELPLLRGKDLQCTCAIGSDCHGDVLLSLANGESK